LALGVLLIPQQVMAGSKSQLFNVPADVLYEGAVHVAAQEYKLTLANGHEKKFAFSTSVSLASWGLNVSAVVQGTSATSAQLVLSIENADPQQVFSWGEGGRVADKFFKDVQMATASWHPVIYQFAMKKPVEQDSLIWEDETAAFTFRMTRKELHFQLKNKVDSPLKIDWNQCSYIDVDGRAHKVLNKETKFKDKENPLSASVVPPTAILEDMVLPADYVKWDRLMGGFTVRELLPHGNAAREYVGRTFSLFMPIEVNGKVANYMFSFTVKGVNDKP
jgi:hypothetical protein